MLVSPTNLRTKYNPTTLITRFTIPSRRRIKLHPKTKQELEDERELAEALALLSLPNEETEQNL